MPHLVPWLVVLATAVAVVAVVAAAIMDRLRK